MKAKINFTGLEVGDHPNILKFIGAVVGDDASKFTDLFFWRTFCLESAKTLFEIRIL